MAEAFVPSFLRSVSSVCVLGFLVVGLIGGFPLLLSLVSETLFQSVDPTPLRVARGFHLREQHLPQAGRADPTDTEEAEIPRSVRCAAASRDHT